MTYISPVIHTFHKVSHMFIILTLHDGRLVHVAVAHITYLFEATSAAREIGVHAWVGTNARGDDDLSVRETPAKIRDLILAAQKAGT